MGNTELLSDSKKHTSLIDLLRYRAVHNHDQIAFTLLVDGENEGSSLTYMQLDLQARALATHLQNLGAAGERVLLLYPTCLEYIVAFFGCIYAGAIAVPAFPPRYNRSSPRIQAIASDSKATIALTTHSILEQLETRLDHHPELLSTRWIGTSIDDPTPEEIPWTPPEISPDDIAYLQYTSGSISSPKGVVNCHNNLLHNLSLLQEIAEGNPGDTVVSWAPLYHDLGLIAFILTPLFVGMPVYLMPPTAFVQKPVRWLRSITRYDAVFSGAPAFAYQYCVDRIVEDEANTLDLSTWKIAICGAETIHPGTLEAFTNKFAPYGLNPTTLLPGYGLAEATLLVSSKPPSVPYSIHTFQRRALELGKVVPTKAEDEAGKEIVSCGRIPDSLNILIVDPETLIPCPPYQIGEVWLSGPSLAQGYWNRPEETSKIFHVSPLGENRGIYLRTGDLGFILGNELYITGRLKEIIIIHGSNYYPQDIEATVQKSHEAIQPHGCIAFSISIESIEKLIIAFEFKRTQRKANLAEVSYAIRRVVAEEYELPVYAIVVTKPGAIPRTSSGKLQRNLCKTLFLNNQLETTEVSYLEEQVDVQKSEYSKAYIAPVSSTEVGLSKIWEQILHLTQIGIYDNFFELGGNSLMATQVVTHARHEFQVELSLNCIYEAPTISSLSALIESMVSIGDAMPELRSVSLVDRTAPIPLSYAQERIWFVHHLNPDGAAYHIPIGLRLIGPFDRDAMVKCTYEILRRHEILRSTFPEIDGHPRQVITSHLEPDIQIVDLRVEANFLDRWSRAREIIKKQVRKPFDLAHGPLIRFAIIQIDDEENLLLINLHHIVGDAWSLGLLDQEVITLYKAYSTLEKPNLPDPPLQYADYAVWQREWLQGEVQEAQLSYWKKQIESLDRLDLPTDFPRPLIQSYNGSVHVHKISAELITRIEHFSHQMGGTLFMTLFAVFNTLLYRYTDQTDICVLVPIANRNSLAAEELVGTLVNTLLMRTDLSGNPSFRQLFARVHKVSLGAYQHQDLPFAELIACMQPERDLSYAPFSQVMFNLINTSFPLLEIENLQVTTFEIDRGAAQFDILFTVSNTPSQKAIKIEYNTDLFKTDTILRMADHFHRLLDEILEDPDKLLSQFQMLGDDERNQLLLDWNDTRKEFADQTTLVELFEAQSAREPEATAFICEQQTISYFELNQKANRLAHYLRSLGAEHGSVIAIFHERSLDLPVGLIGILKTGAAYLPLETSYPIDRIKYVLSDAQVSIIVTQESLLQRLGQLNIEIVCLDTNQHKISGMPSSNLTRSSTVDSLAYVLYTSGSTGEPIGVQGLHRGAVNRFSWMWEEFPFRDGEVCCQKTALSFVDSVWELFGPLLQNIPNVIIPERVVNDPTQLVSQLRKNHVTRLVLVPSLLGAILEAYPNLGASLPDLYLWISSGESLTVDLVRRFQEAMPSATLLNLYGSTEVAADVTYFDTANLKPEHTNVPIGRPIANTSIYILDNHMNPVPVGIPGEIHVGGAGLAQGYHHRPDLTNLKFVENPFSEDLQVRLYKTGDIARYLEDGNIEFLGRRDFQVNLRGFRIELREIEIVLCKHEAVHQAAVKLLEINNENYTSLLDANIKNEHLAAFIVTKYDCRISASELQAYLKSKLPAFMIPSQIFFCEKMPLTHSGKIDRSALKQLDGELYAEQTIKTESIKDEIDNQLILLWEKLLGVQSTSMQDNFFDCGGHSLMAVRLFAKIEEIFGIRLPIATIFQAPTIEQLGQIIRKQETVRDWSSLIPLQKGSRERFPLFIVHGLSGGVMDYGGLARMLGPDQPVYGLQARGMNNSDPPHTRIEDMAAYYIDRICSIQPQGPFFVCGYSFGGVVAFEIARQLHESGKEVGLLANLDGYAPIQEHQADKLWPPRNFVRFVTNLLYWLKDEWSQPQKSKQWKSYFKKANIILQRMLPRGNLDSMKTRSIFQEFEGEMTEYAPQILRHVEAHLQAFYNFKPLPFPGHMTLFRVRTLSLTRWYDQKLGWGKYVTKGIDIKMISGAHYDILKMPHVEMLAKELRASLE